MSIADSVLLQTIKTEAPPTEPVVPCLTCHKDFVWWLHPVQLCEACVEAEYAVAEIENQVLNSKDNFMSINNVLELISTAYIRARVYAALIFEYRKHEDLALNALREVIVPHAKARGIALPLISEQFLGFEEDPLSLQEWKRSVLLMTDHGPLYGAQAVLALASALPNIHWGPVIRDLLLEVCAILEKNRNEFFESSIAYPKTVGSYLTVAQESLAVQAARKVNTLRGIMVDGQTGAYWFGAFTALQRAEGPSPNKMSHAGEDLARQIWHWELVLRREQQIMLDRDRAVTVYVDSAD